jgi:MFS family permease
MPPKELIARNPRLLFWGRAMLEIKMLSAVIVLFYEFRGLDIKYVFWLSVVWSVAALLSEIPSGILADRFGRKRTLILGAFFFLVFNVILMFANSPWHFALVFVCMASAFSCFSGTEEALLRESLTELGICEEQNDRYGKQLASRVIFPVIGALAGAYIAQDLLEKQFLILLSINCLGAVFGIILLSFLTEPIHQKKLGHNVIQIYQQSIRTIRNDLWLLKATLNKLLIFVAMFLVWRMHQPFLVDRGLTIIQLGLYASTSFLLVFCTRFFIGKLEKRVGTVWLINGAAFGCLLGLMITLLTDNGWIAFVAINLITVFQIMRDPLFFKAMNDRIENESRSTTISNLSSLKALIDVPLLFLAGWLASINMDYVVALSVGLCLIVLIALPIREHELHTKNP